MATKTLCDVCGVVLEDTTESASIVFESYDQRTTDMTIGARFDLDLCRKHKNELEYHVREWVSQPMVEEEPVRNTPAT